MMLNQSLVGVIVCALPSTGVFVYDPARWPDGWAVVISRSGERLFVFASELEHLLLLLSRVRMQ